MKLVPVPDVGAMVKVSDTGPGIAEEEMSFGVTVIVNVPGIPELAAGTVPTAGETLKGELEPAPSAAMKSKLPPPALERVKVWAARPLAPQLLPPNTIIAVEAVTDAEPEPEPQPAVAASRRNTEGHSTPLLGIRSPLSVESVYVQVRVNI
jgi:hypothetical protein